ncbi:unnamed protein product [marine sediment metagenome]|uniref:Uncharacterized protein n=1 Tax=marine sediment metagenome TaxID=412755 RepID=X1EHT5_9ZZZZ
MVKTIAVSEEAYEKAMAKKREMEKRVGKIISMADAVEADLRGEGGTHKSQKPLEDIAEMRRLWQH